MDRKTTLVVLERIRQKQAGITDMLPAGTAAPALPSLPEMPTPPPAPPSPGSAFAGAVHDMASSQLKTDALRDVRNVALASLGIGAAGRGAVGLLNSFQRDRKKKPKGGPLLLPLPYPEEKSANFLGGDSAIDKSGIPWYMPATLLGGMAGLGVGWKGMDSVLHSRRKAETDAELQKARSEFHDALLSQYDQPVANRGGSSNSITAKMAAEPTEMTKVGSELDQVWDNFQLLMKRALDLGNLAGGATGMYGAYAGLSGLLSGALIYDKVSKRSRRAIIEKAQQRRDRRNFMQRPNEIYAIPEAVHTPVPSPGLAPLATDPEE